MSSSATVVLALGILLGGGLQRGFDSLTAAWWPAARPACVGQQELAAELTGLKESLFASHLGSGLAVGIVVASVIFALWASEWLLPRAPKVRALAASAAVDTTPVPVTPPRPQVFSIADQDDEFDAQLLLAYRPSR